MAGTSGAAAYQRLEKPDNAISQGLQYWGGLQAQANEADKNRALQAKAQAAKAKQDFDKGLDLTDKDFLNTATGFQSYDDIKRDYAMASKQEYVDLATKAKDLYAQGKYKEADSLSMELSKRKGNFKLINNAEVVLKEKFDAIVKAQAEGKVSGVDSELIQMMQPFTKNNVRIVNDEKGNPTLKYLLEDEEGNKSVVTKSYSELVDPSTPYIAKQDLYGDKGVVNNLATKLGTITTTNNRGVNTWSSQVWDDKRQGAAVRTELEAYLKSDEVLADVLNQMGQNDNQRSGFSEAQRHTALNHLYDSVRSRYNEKTEKGLNIGLLGLQQRQREFAYQKQQDAKPKDFTPIARVSTPEEASATILATAKSNHEMTPDSQAVFEQFVKDMETKGGGTFAFGKPIEFKAKGSVPTSIVSASLSPNGDITLIGSQFRGNKTVRGEDGVTVSSPVYEPVFISEKAAPEIVASALTGLYVDDAGTRFENLDDARQYFKELKTGSGNTGRVTKTTGQTNISSSSKSTTRRYVGLDDQGNPIFE